MIIGQVEGKAAYRRSGRETAVDEQCSCCEGQHVFACGFETDEWDQRPYRKNIEGWVSSMISKHRNDPAWEGKRLRITVETIDG